MDQGNYLSEYDSQRHDISGTAVFAWTHPTMPVNHLFDVFFFLKKV